MADFDVIVVGAGCAGSVAAYELANAGKSVLLVERGEDAGSKNMTGGRIYAHSLAQVFPDYAQEAPLERKITRERISMMTPTDNTSVDFTSPRLSEPENVSYAVLRGPFDSWLASKAEEAGAECIFGIAVEDLVWEDGRIAGVRAGDDEITAEIVILADGVNSLLTEKAKLGSRPKPSQIAVGVKETISLPEKVIDDRFGSGSKDGMAWLFAGAPTKGHIGGGFLYTNRESVSIGLVATLSDLCTSDTPIYQMMEDFKNHPAVAPLLSGGEIVEYSGHLVPEGGFDMVSKLYADGCLVAGDAAMLCINLGYQVRGMDYAIASGQIAARTAIEALDACDVSESRLSRYKAKLEDSFVLKDLMTYRSFPHFLESTPRMFNEYPEMTSEIMGSLFVVDGKPVTPIKQSVMGAVKKVGMMNLFKDVRKGAKSL